MDLILKPFQLTTGMNSLALASISILMHDGNNWTTLGVDNSTNSDNRKPTKFMAINATHINSSWVL